MTAGVNSLPLVTSGHEHSKINQKIEDVGSRMLRLEFRTLRDLQTAWRDVETRIENFESMYGLAFRRNLQDATTRENISPQKIYRLMDKVEELLRSRKWAKDCLRVNIAQPDQIITRGKAER